MPAKIYTHSGRFHTDEVTGCALLRLLHPDLEIVRTRDLLILDQTTDDDYVLDVGRVYDPARRRYDHHQKGFELTFDESTKIPMSSAGMVWLNHGRDVCLKLADDTLGLSGDETIVGLAVDETYKKVYRWFIRYIDAHDNGIVLDSSRFSYGLCISHFNKLFTDTTFDETVFKVLPEDEKEAINRDQHRRKLLAFEEAVTVSKNILCAIIVSTLVDELYYMREYEKLVSCFVTRKHPEIMELPFQPNNITRFLSELDPDQAVKFIITPRFQDGHEMTQVWTVDYDHQKFNTYVPILPLDEARQTFGNHVEFVHNNRHIAVVKTSACGVELAKDSLKAYLKYNNLPTRVTRLAKWGFSKVAKRLFF